MSQQLPAALTAGPMTLRSTRQPATSTSGPITARPSCEAHHFTPSPTHPDDWAPCRV